MVVVFSETLLVVPVVIRHWGLDFAMAVPRLCLHAIRRKSFDFAFADLFPICAQRGSIALGVALHHRTLDFRRRPFVQFLEERVGGIAFLFFIIVAELVPVFGAVLGRCRICGSAWSRGCEHCTGSGVGLRCFVFGGGLSDGLAALQGVPLLTRSRLCEDDFDLAGKNARNTLFDVHGCIEDLG
jgi:hypothetical protein